MGDKDLTWRDGLILEIEELAKKCQDVFEYGEGDEHFDEFIEKWDFNERYEPGLFAYGKRNDNKLVEMKVDLLMVYLDMKLEG